MFDRMYPYDSKKFLKKADEVLKKLYDESNGMDFNLAIYLACRYGTTDMGMTDKQLKELSNRIWEKESLFNETLNEEAEEILSHWGEEVDETVLDLDIDDLPF